MYSATAGLLVFAVFYLVKPVYYRSQEKTLSQKLQAQISALNTPDNTANEIGISQIKETKADIARLQTILRNLSKDTLIYERDFILLDSLESNYQYAEELSGLMAKIFEYNPETDLNSRSISEYKGDFMYRLSLTQYALRQITARLKKMTTDRNLPVYTKEITAQFPPMIDLANRLIETTKKDRIETSNQLRLQYINDFKQLQASLKLLAEQTLQKLGQTNQTLLTQIKI